MTFLMLLFPLAVDMFCALSTPIAATGRTVGSLLRLSLSLSLSLCSCNVCVMWLCESVCVRELVWFHFHGCPHKLLHLFRLFCSALFVHLYPQRRQPPTDPLNNPVRSQLRYSSHTTTTTRRDKVQATINPKPINQPTNQRTTAATKHSQCSQ